MKKFIFKSSLYILIILFICNIISYIGFKIIRDSNIYKPSYILHNLDNLKNLDYLILGSSLGLTGLDTQKVDSITGLKGFNISLDGMIPSGQYMMLEHCLNNGVSADMLLLFVDTYSNDLKDSFPHDYFSMNEFYFLSLINNDYIYNCFKEREKKWLKFRSYSRYFPVLGFSYYNQQLLGSCMISLKNKNARWHFDENGNEYYRDNKIKLNCNNEISLNYENKITIDTLVIRNYYIKKIEDICNRNNIKLFYILPPMYSKHTIVSDNSKRNILNYRDIFNNNPMYFYDCSHVNMEGRSNMSEIIGQWLKQKYNN